MYYIIFCEYNNISSANMYIYNMQREEVSIFAVASPATADIPYIYIYIYIYILVWQWSVDARAASKRGPLASVLMGAQARAHQAPT